MSSIRLKPSKKCIFCGNGKLTREHIWPDWAAQELPDWPKAVQAKYVVQGKYERQMGAPVLRKRQGGVKNIRIRVVCGPCNNGWMSRLEEGLKPLLLKLIRGEPTELSVEDLVDLTRWATLKAMVAEQDSHSEPVYQTQERLAFFEHRTVPEGTRVWLFDCGVGVWASHYVRRAAALASARVEGFKPNVKNTHTIALGIGRLLIFLLYTHRDEAKFSFTMSPRRSRIAWPAESGASWPPERRLTIGEADDIAASMAVMLRDPRVIYVPG